MQEIIEERGIALVPLLKPIPDRKGKIKVILGPFEGAREFLDRPLTAIVRLFAKVMGKRRAQFRVQVRSNCR